LLGADLKNGSTRIIRGKKKLKKKKADTHPPKVRGEACRGGGKKRPEGRTPNMRVESPEHCDRQDRSHEGKAMSSSHLGSRPP